MADKAISDDNDIDKAVSAERLENGNEERSVESEQDTQFYGNATGDLHLELTISPLQPPPALSREALDEAWIRLQAGVAISSWGPAPNFPLIEGVVSQKLEQDDSHGRILRMTQSFTSIDECEIPYDSITGIIIHKTVHRSHEHLPERDRVFSGQHQLASSDSWSSTTPDLGYEPTAPQSTTSETTPQPPEVVIELPLLPNGNIDLMRLQAMYRVAKWQGELLPDFCNRVGLNIYMNQPDRLHQEPLQWLQVLQVLPEDAEEIQKEYFLTYPHHQTNFDQWWEMIGKNGSILHWSPGTAATRGEEFFRRKERMQAEAINFIQQLPDQLRPLAYQKFGMWSAALAITQFSIFSTFLNNDREYIEALHNFMNSSTAPSSQSESSNELQQWTEVMPPATKANLTVEQLKKLLTTEEPTEQQQHRLATEGKIYSQVLLDPDCEISPEDFLQGGRLSMIHVPNYIYVPPLAIEVLTGARQVSPSDNLILWQRMKHSRDRASIIIAATINLWHEHEHPMPELNTPWMQLASSAPPKHSWTPDTKNLHKIDELQHVAAHHYWEQFHHNKTPEKKSTDCYDLFIRPLEQLFAANRPLSTDLVTSARDSIQANWLTNQIAKIAGIEKWISINVHPLLEISRIRHLSAEQLARKTNAGCNPYQRLPPMQFNTLTPARPAEKENSDLIPKVEDFNVGGRLHGIYVAPNMKMPSHILRRFTAKKVSEEEEKKFHQDVIITRMQWVNDINTQLLIQKGLKPATEKVSQPTWLDRAEASATTTTATLMTKSIAEKISQLHLTIEDFLIGGRLQHYPTEGVLFLSDAQTRELGMSNLTAKESKMLLSHINKTMREMKRTIIAARKQQEKKVTHLENKLANIKSNLTKDVATSTTATKLSRLYTMSLSQSQERKKKKELDQLTSTPAPIFSRSTSITPPRTRTSPPSPPPRPRKQRGRGPRVFYGEDDEEIYQQVTPHKKERSRSARRVEAHNPQYEWGKKEEEKKTTAPIRSASAHFQPRPRFEAALVFENHPYNRHNQIWVGDTKNAPNWAKITTSANAVSKLHINHIPCAHKSRNIVQNQYRSVPLDGVHNVQDLIIKNDHNSANLTINVISTTKKRELPVSHTVTKQMNICSKDWNAFLGVIEQTEFDLLPPTINDPTSPDPTIRMYQQRGARFSYIAQTKYTPGMRGCERTVVIQQNDDKNKQIVSFDLPWRFLTIFRVKFEAIQCEIEEASVRQK